MPATAFSVNSEVLSTTAMATHKEVQDTLWAPYPFVEQIEKTKGKDTGGYLSTVAWNFGEHSETTQLSTGYEPINMNVKETMEAGTYTPGDWVRPIVISGHESRINSGPEQIVKLAEERTKNTNLGLRAQLNDQLLLGNVGVMSDLITLNGNYGTGLIEARAISAQINTIHGISRATHRTLGFTNQWYDGAGSFGTNGLVGMYDITSRIHKIAGGIPKSVKGYISLGAANALKKALQTNERYLSTESLDAGRMVLVYNGVQLQIVDLLTGATPWSVLFVDHDKIKFIQRSDFWFKLYPFTDQPGYDVQAARLHLMGQTVGSYFGTSGLLTDADVF